MLQHFKGNLDHLSDAITHDVRSRYPRGTFFVHLSHVNITISRSTSHINYAVMGIIYQSCNWLI